MNTELYEALTLLEKEKGISKDILLDAIENSLLTACEKNFGKHENIHVVMDHDTCDYHVYADKTVVEKVEDPVEQILLDRALLISPTCQLGDIIQVEFDSKNFGRIASQNAKSVILQKIREEERRALYQDYYQKAHQVVTGTVQRFIGKNISVNLGKLDAMLPESEQVKGETLTAQQRVKVYVVDVKDSNKGPRIQVSRTHPELVKRLFEEEVAEVHDGTVVIKAISREAGSRTKIAVWSEDPDVDAVGACVGISGSRVNTVVDELGGEKIDIISWDENPALLIENALSPAKVIAVWADEEENAAQVIVPDMQLSLAIGKEGQNARLAAKLTGFKIDIKSETQARELGYFDSLEGMDFDSEYEGYGSYDEDEEDSEWDEENEDYEADDSEEIYEEIEEEDAEAEAEEAEAEEAEAEE